MKKEQETEAAKRVAEERSKRAAHDQQSQHTTSNGHEKVKQPETPPINNQPIQEPYSPPVHQPNIQSSPIYENFSNKSETQQEKIVGGVNVSSLLRTRKASSSSSKNDDDEWAENNHNEPYRNPSPVPAVQSQQPINDEGIRCIARYSYQKSKIHY